MKKDHFFSLVLMLLAILFLASCSKQGVTQQPPVESAAAATAVVTADSQNPSSSSPTATMDVEALIQSKLDDHHGMDIILGATKTREEWNATLDRMIGYGAKISEEEKQIIIDYLLSR